MRVPFIVAAVAIASALGLTAAPAAPTATPPASTVAGGKVTFERGVAVFYNRDELPNTKYWIRGKLEVTFGTEYVVVRNFSSAETYVIPARRVFYVGSKDLDAKEDVE
jgi:hypothetical protein